MLVMMVVIKSLSDARFWMGDELDYVDCAAGSCSTAAAGRKMKGVTSPRTAPDNATSSKTRHDLQWCKRRFFAKMYDIVNKEHFL